MGKADAEFRPAGGEQGMFSWPSTKLGKLSVGLIIAAMLLAAAKFMVHTIALCGLVGGCIALVAIARKHERSLLVWLSLAVGLMLSLFLLAELLTPH